MNCDRARRVLVSTPLARCGPLIRRHNIMRTYLMISLSKLKTKMGEVLFFELTNLLLQLYRRTIKFYAKFYRELQLV